MIFVRPFRPSGCFYGIDIDARSLRSSVALKVQAGSFRFLYFHFTHFLFHQPIKKNKTYKREDNVRGFADELAEQKSRL